MLMSSSKIIKLTYCGTITVVMDIILSIIGDFFEHC